MHREYLQDTLFAIAEQAPDVLPLDSTLARNSALSIIIQVRERIPALPVVLLPDIYGVLHQPQDLPRAGGNRTRFGLVNGAVPDSAMQATDTIARTIRHDHRQLDSHRALLHKASRDDLRGPHKGVQPDPGGEDGVRSIVRRKYKILMQSEGHGKCTPS